jgi:hypothetical protein
MMVMEFADPVTVGMTTDMNVDLGFGGRGAQEGDGEQGGDKRFHAIFLDLMRFEQWSGPC